MRFRLIILSAVLVLGFLGCSKKEEENNQAVPSNNHKVVIEEVQNATSYTYARVKEGDKEYWIAINKTNLNVGETMYFIGGLEMKDFESKDLKKTFESLLLVDRLSPQPIGTGAVAQSPQMATPQKPTLEKMDIKVASVQGAVTVADIYSNPSSFVGKTVKVRGKVTKVNNGIMGKNWIHIQDGTESNGKFDLTITTQESVKVGDEITIGGIIAVNKDFGYGYAYEVLLEDGVLIK